MKEEGVKVLQTQPNFNLSLPGPEDSRGYTALPSSSCLQPHCKSSNYNVFHSVQGQVKDPHRRAGCGIQRSRLAKRFCEERLRNYKGRESIPTLRDSCTERQQSAFNDPAALPPSQQTKICVSFVNPHTKAQRGMGCTARSCHDSVRTFPSSYLCSQPHHS